MTVTAGTAATGVERAVTEDGVDIGIADQEEAGRVLDVTLNGRSLLP